jgi:CDP-glycerol glycerophosphotransferase
VGRRLNLWHGIPLKDLGFLSEAFNLRTELGFGEDWLLHTSLREIGPMLRAFPGLMDRVLIANLPRNAILVNTNLAANTVKDEDKRLIQTIRARCGELGARCVGYFPTWRKGNSDLFLGCASPEQIEDLIRFLEDQSLVLVTKWHACTFAEYNYPDKSTIIDDTTTQLSGSRHVITLPFAADLNSYLELCELLLTDYSSVFFDYLWLDRPIVFNPYDLTAYTAEFGLNYDYQTFVPGPIASTPIDVMDHLSRFVADPAGNGTLFHEKRMAMRDRFFDIPESSSELLKALQRL